MIRYRVQRQLLLDDIFFFLGVLCLCAAFGLLIKLADFMYSIEPIYTLNMPMDRFNEIGDAYMALTYTTLFSVKLSFLLFFRILVRRIRTMIVYWWTVLAITCIAWPVSIVAAVAPSCSIFGSLSSIVKSSNFLLRLTQLMHDYRSNLLWKKSASWKFGCGRSCSRRCCNRYIMLVYFTPITH